MRARRRTIASDRAAGGDGRLNRPSQKKFKTPQVNRKASAATRSVSVNTMMASAARCSAAAGARRHAWRQAIELPAPRRLARNERAGGIRTHSAMIARSMFDKRALNLRHKNVKLLSSQVRIGQARAELLMCCAPAQATPEPQLTHIITRPTAFRLSCT